MHNLIFVLMNVLSRDLWENNTEGRVAEQEDEEKNKKMEMR